MSDKTQPKQPSHLAYQVSEGKEGQSFFNRVGAAFPHKDEKGYNLKLDAIPVDGNVTIRENTPRAERDNEGHER
ncbi:hypothetical protein [Kordiimonas sp.]|uniref:hypothetical protein n=1 Tax=Kordiimonas sp. TaxID=1970157 RepID=UPI003A93BD68